MHCVAFYYTISNGNSIITLVSDQIPINPAKCSFKPREMCFELNVLRYCGGFIKNKLSVPRLIGSIRGTIILFMPAIQTSGIIISVTFVCIFSFRFVDFSKQTNKLISIDKQHRNIDWEVMHRRQGKRDTGD